jgi:hypothetical protein
METADRWPVRPVAGLSCCIAVDQENSSHMLKAGRLETGTQRKWMPEGAGSESRAGKTANFAAFADSA